MPEAVASARPGFGVNPAIVRLIATRIGTSVLLLLAVSVVVFAGTELLPGDVAQMVLGQGATPAALQGLREVLHLDQSAPVRYLRWLGGMLTGDPATSLVNGMAVAELVRRRLGNSLRLALLTTI